MAITKFHAHSWDDLQRAIFPTTPDKDINRYRGPLAFRGLPNKEFHLATSLMRFSDPYPGVENNLIKQFIKYGYPHVDSTLSEWHQVSMAQHYGLPTRLLDWTCSPLVALHFATTDLLDPEWKTNPTDGVVWVVNYSQSHELLPRKYKRILKKSRSRIFPVDVLANEFGNVATFESYATKKRPIGLFFEPQSIEERIQNQFAYFSVLTDPKMSMDDWLKKKHVKSKVSAKKIIIKHKLKWKIRDYLDQSNINERILFPGPDGLCKWLKRHYYNNK